MRWTRRALWVGLAVASLASGCTTEAPGGPAETSADGAPVRSPTTTAPPPPTLERVAAEPGVLSAAGDQRMLAVAADPDGTVAVAVGLDDGGPAAWRATEAGTWARVALGGGVPGDAVLSHLAHIDDGPGGGTFAVVGSVRGAAAAWTTTDGRSWRRVEVDAGPPITHVADTGLGPVAFATGAGAGAVWKSFDGSFWVRSFDQPGTFERPGAARVVGVVDAVAGLVALVEREDQGPEVWASPDGFAWQVGPATGTDLLPAPGPPRASGLVDAGDGLVVVVGSTAEADGVDAAAWTSSAARTWERGPHDEAVLGGDGGQQMAAVAVVDGTVVAVGSEVAGQGDGLDAAVWSSSDGLRWQRADTARLRSPGRQQVTGLTVLGGTAVAVGWDDPGGEADAAVWVIGAEEEPAPAPGGSPTPAWVRLEGGSALEAPGEQRLAAVAALDDGLVAVGSVRSPVGVVADEGPSRRVGPVQVGDSDGAVWRSDDGRSWHRAADAALGGEGDQRALALVAGARGTGAFGVDGDDAAAWWSSDGRRWERVGAPALAAEGRQVATSVIAVGDTFLVAGRDEGEGDEAEGEAAVWASPDGRIWRRLPAEGLAGPGRSIAGLALGSDGVVAVGTDGAGAVAWTTGDLRTWSATPLGPGTASAVAGLDGAVVAVGAAPGGDGELDAVTWRLAGSLWERSEGGALAGPADQELLGVVLSDVVAVAVGRTSFGGGDDAASWSSADAGTWVRTIHDEAVLGGDQSQRMEGVAVLGTTAVAVGWSGSTSAARDAVVWVADQLDVAGAERNL